MGLWDLRPLLPPCPPSHCTSYLLSQPGRIDSLRGTLENISLIPLLVIRVADLHTVLRAEQGEEARSADERRRVDR